MGRKGYKVVRRPNVNIRPPSSPSGGSDVNWPPPYLADPGAFQRVNERPRPIGGHVGSYTLYEWRCETCGQHQDGYSLFHAAQNALYVHETEECPGSEEETTR